MDPRTLPQTPSCASELARLTVNKQRNAKRPATLADPLNVDDPIKSAIGQKVKKKVMKKMMVKRKWLTGRNRGHTARFGMRNVPFPEGNKEKTIAFARLPV